jgi:hypothetical protein
LAKRLWRVFNWSIKRSVHETLCPWPKETPPAITFQDEYRKFLAAYGIDFDERYLWD